MSDAPAPVRCDGCGALGRRRIGHPCPDFWFFLESKDTTVGSRGVYIVWACSEDCRSDLWQRGPGPASIAEEDTNRMRHRLSRKEPTDAG